MLSFADITGLRDLYFSIYAPFGAANIEIMFARRLAELLNSPYNRPKPQFVRTYPQREP